MAFSILSGALFVPVQVEAGLLASFFGDQALAETNVQDTSPFVRNLQNLEVLEAKASYSSIIKDKKNTKDENESLSSPADTTSNALVPLTGPTGVSDGKDVPDPSLDQISIYVARKGDSVSQIANMFGVSVNTILSANDMKKGEKLTEGDVLLILPISGVEHTVIKGQTLKSIAKIYKVDATDIAIYNSISEDDKLAIGDKLIIPGGEMSDEGGDKPASNLGSAIAKDTNYYITHPIQALLGFFINPVPTGHKTQGLHGPGNRGIDIGAPVGTPIYAAASGKVLIIKTGCKVGKVSCGGGYGNMAIVQHPNGTKTLYGHMSKLNTSTGAQVAQGQIIGYVGNTGHSTGPHIHFEVYSAKNPGSDWSWAN
ncbi:MAG: M23 family metallopeptidase [bacterium]